MKPEEVPAWMGLPYETSLTLDLAVRMLEAGQKEAVVQNVPMGVCVVDAGTNLIALHRMDKAPLLVVQNAINKANTAVWGKRESGYWKKSYEKSGILSVFWQPGWAVSSGGFPIIKNGVILGAVGVSGGYIEDVFVARAMLRVGGFDTSDPDGLIAAYEAKKKAGGAK